MNQPSTPSSGLDRRRRGRIARLTRVASATAVAAVLVVGGAGPAGAVPQRTLSIDPADDVDTPPVVTGSFKGASLVVSVEKISAVDLKVSPIGPTSGSPITQNGCEVASDGACNSSAISYTWQIPQLAFNGPYRVEATGRYCDPLLCLNPESASAPPVEFRLGVDPAPPGDIRTEPGDNRSVTVSWARNAEPDMLYYALFRKDPGGDFRRLGNDIKHPASGRATFTDTSVTGTNGGDFVYKVFAVRKGFSGDEKTTRISKASADRAINVAPPPTTTLVPGTDPNTPTTIAAGQGVDIGSFLSGQVPTLPTPPPIFLDLPDTGFGEILPFGVLPDEAEPGEEEAVLPTTPRQREIARFDNNRPLIPVAAGALLLVLAAHIRLLNVRTKPTVVARKLPPGAYVARALAEARSTPVVVDMATAVANGGHHRAPPPTDDVAGLPVWAEFEPVSAMGLFDEYDGNGNGGADLEFEGHVPESRPVVVAEPASLPEPEPAVDLVYDFDDHDDSRWSAEPEVFVAPRS